MTGVRISGLGKSYGALRVLDDLDLDVPAGSTTAVLGSSGCGKSTLLRIVAGFVRPDAGTVHVGERLVAGPGTQVAAQHRGVGYVPQEGALFPHLTVAGNVLFGLGRRERSTQRRDELLDLAELPSDLADRYPHELSGGQQQRVALARALAPRPAVVLLDEPFSSLDTALRASAGRTVTRVLRNAGATAILVTHDQGEALSLADQVAVMRGGRFVQVAPPSVVYGRPADAETALSVGGATLLAGEVAGPVASTELGELALLEVPKPGPAQVLLRPEQVEVTWDGDPRHPAATVREVDYHGAQVVVRLELASGAALTAHCPGTLPPEPGDVVGIRIVGPVIAYPDGDPA